MAEVDEICTACNGTGLKDQHTLCPVCGGTPSSVNRANLAKAEEADVLGEGVDETPEPPKEETPVAKEASAVK